MLRAGGAAAVRERARGARCRSCASASSGSSAAGDRGTPEGRDRILGQLRPIFAELGPGAMREELEREVASRLEVSETPSSSCSPDAARTAPRTRWRRWRSPTLGAGERTERTFLELCIALPGCGRRAARRARPRHGLRQPARARRRRAPAHPPRRPGQRASTDAALGALLAELAVRAAALAPVPAELEVERRQLELARVDRAIAGARGGDAARLSDLGREREAVKRELDGWLDRVRSSRPRARET